MLLKKIIPLCFALSICNTSFADETISHVVKKGDTLWSISLPHLNNRYQWSELIDNNYDIIDPDLIYPNDIVYLDIKDDGDIFVNIDRINKYKTEKNNLHFKLGKYSSQYLDSTSNNLDDLFYNLKEFYKSLDTDLLVLGVVVVDHNNKVIIDDSYIELLNEKFNRILFDNKNINVMFEGNRNDDMTFSYVDFRYGLKSNHFFKISDVLKNESWFIIEENNKYKIYCLFVDKRKSN